jgi:peptide-methionine (S)-S-oxide reductase
MLLSSGAALRAEEDTAIFAAGCFWCVEEAFDGVPGVLETTSGYTGGTVVNPTYRQVTRGNTGHLEALKVRFDPAEVSYAELLEVFWRNVDPFDDGGQFCDRGSSYLSAIFVKDEAQRAAAEASRARLASDPRAPGTLVTPIREAAPFYAAEDYHQDYHRKNPWRYKYYKNGCGRPARLRELWGEP